MKYLCLLVGIGLGSLLSITKEVEAEPPKPEPIEEIVLASCLNGGFVVDGELWLCIPTGMIEHD